MNRIEGVDFFQGDICDPVILQKLIKRINGRKVNVVLSDMSPKVSGVASVDVSKSIYLAEIALSLCKYILIFGGSFLVKIFQGEGFCEYFRNVCAIFTIVRIRKPFSSRIHSREVYIVAKGYKYKK